MKSRMHRRAVVPQHKHIQDALRLSQEAIRARVVEEVPVKGQVRDVEAAIAAPGGEPVLIGTFADITERRRAEQALHDLSGELD